MLMSGVVYPGTGQFMQRRWFSGTVVGIAFTIPFAWFVVDGVAIMKAFCLDLDFDHATFKVPSYSSLLMPFAFSVAVYLAGLVDTALADYRARMKAHQPGSS